MLFDLRGRRRRAVQATYLTLAVLMGGGLVLFGIGGDVSGGLFDAFSDRSGGSSSSGELEDRIDRFEERLAANPQNEAALKELVRSNFALAGASLPSGATQYPDEAKDELRAASNYWQRYLEVEDGEPDASLARVAIAVYDPGALNQPKRAAQATRVLADADSTYQNYLALVQRATAAGDKRTANLAGQRAVDLAPERLRKRVEKQVKQLKKPATPQPVPTPPEQ
jgi:hypothetical protein